MQKICKTCNQNFEITDDDLIFLEKISPVFKEYWPKPILSNLLKSLPPHFEIKVDPDNLL